MPSCRLCMMAGAGDLGLGTSGLYSVRGSDWTEGGSGLPGRTREVAGCTQAGLFSQLWDTLS